MMNISTDYSNFLDELSKDPTVIKELLPYCKNNFIINKKNEKLKRNNSKQTFAIWEECITASKKKGVIQALKSSFVQFQFPVKNGISKTKEYKNTTLKGIHSTSNFNFEDMLIAPKLIQLKIYNSIAGQVPVLIVPNDKDFNIIIAALSRKNELITFPPSMGAAFINGIINWKKLRQLKFNSEKYDNKLGWQQNFNQYILANPELYKDQMIVLSKKPYSNINGYDINFETSNWLEISLKLRLEHECAHLFTLKKYNTISNNLHDEIVADYFAITKYLGYYNKTWFLKFMGLENYPNYRKGGRLENYTDKNKISDNSFKVLKKIVYLTAQNINAFDKSIGTIINEEDLKIRMSCICEIDLLSMATGKGSFILKNKYRILRKNAQ